MDPALQGARWLSGPPAEDAQVAARLLEDLREFPQAHAAQVAARPAEDLRELSWDRMPSIPFDLISISHLT